MSVKVNYRKIWENYNNVKLKPNQEVHHIDGNRKNNSPENLMAVTIEEHLDIHLKQNDFGAVQAILMRMKSNNLSLKEFASKNQKRLYLEGKHNFQKIDPNKRKEISKKIGLKTKELNIGIHKINSDPILASENAKNGRKHLSREKELAMMEAWKNKIKNSYWWNDGIKNVRSKECPGINFRRGMKK